MQPVTVAAVVAALCLAVASCGSRSSLRTGVRSDGPSGSGASSGGGRTPTTTTGGGMAGMAGMGGMGGDTTTSSSTGPPCVSDAECDDTVDCTIDTCTPSGCTNEPSDLACDDNIFCTVDTCHPTNGCGNVQSNAPCDDGIPCTSDTCDAVLDACKLEPCDSACDDNVFCNGVERCDTMFGCTQGPIACDLGLGCGTSTCSEAQDTCATVLPPNCVPPDLRVLVTDTQGRLFEVKPYENGASTLIAPSNGTVHLDVSIVNGRWFVIDQASLVELQPMTNTVIATHSTIQANSLGTGPDGKLYAANDSAYRIDPDTGVAELITALPVGHSSSGDIAFLGNRMFVSTNSDCGGALVEVDTTAKTSWSLGGDGLGCAYGLAPHQNRLVLMNCDGTIGIFDPDTGIAGVLSSTSITAYGAELLP